MRVGRSAVEVGAVCWGNTADGGGTLGEDERTEENGREGRALFSQAYIF